MRKVISILAALALVGSVAAAPKKPAAKPAKPAVAVPAIPAVPAVPKTTAPTGGAKFIINAWGGYSINGRTDLVKAVDSFASATETTAAGFTAKAVDETTKGVAGGLDLLYGEKFQFGVGAYYLQGFKTTKTNTYGTAKVNHTTQMNYIPILAQIRYFIFEGLYVGIGAGVAVAISGKSEGSLTGTTATGWPYSTAYSGTLLWGEGRLGYNLKISDLIGIDIFGIVSYQDGKVDFQTTDSTGALLAATSVKNSGVNITPGLGISLRF